MFKKIIFLFVPFWMLNTELLANEYQYIWAEEEDLGSAIYFSEMKNGQWQAKETIVDNNLLNILPSLTVNSSGDKLAVWTVATIINNGESRNHLQYSLKQGSNWTSPKILTSQFETNLAATAMADKNDQFWVVWSANNGDDDDIYVSNFNSGLWSTPHRIHDDNSVADFLPTITLNEADQLEIEWSTLDNENNRIIQNNSVLQKSQWVQDSRLATNRSVSNQLNGTAESQTLKQISKPPFAKQFGLSTMVEKTESGKVFQQKQEYQP